jgi:hypothetical protein
MRILHAIGGDTVQDLNGRYRQVSPFGKGTIRRFTGNPSAMRKLAARDFEDLLQVWTPWYLGSILYHFHTVRSPGFRGPTVHTQGKQSPPDPPVRPCYMACLRKTEATHRHDA